MHTLLLCVRTHLIQAGFNTTQLSTGTHISAADVTLSVHALEISAWIGLGPFQGKYIKSHPLINLKPTPHPCAPPLTALDPGPNLALLSASVERHFPQEVEALTNPLLQSESDNIMIFPQENKNINFDMACS